MKLELQNLVPAIGGYHELFELKPIGKDVREPGLFRAYRDVTGDEVVVKLWRLGLQTEQSAIRAIWRDELRHAAKLSGRPSTDSLLVPIIETIDKPEYLALVLQPNFRLPLAWHLENSKKRLSLPQSNRLDNWMNLLRLAKALGILHAQGMVHRNVGSWSVYTSFEATTDFQLSGFESCFDLTSTIQIEPKTSETNVFSFRRDWIDFGLLAASLLGVSVNSSIDDVLFKIRDSKLGIEERRLLRSLLKPSMVENTTSDAVIKSIEKLISKTKQTTAIGRGSYKLVVSFDPRSDIATVLGSAGLIGSNEDAEGIRRGIEADLVSPVRASTSSDSVVVVYGRALTYTLRRFRDSWSAGRCVKVERAQMEPTVLPHSTTELLASISVMSASEMSKESSGVAINWMSINENQDITSNVQGATAIEEGMRLLLHMQALVAICGIWPVRVHEQLKQGRGEYVINVRPREETIDQELRPELLLENLADTIRDELRDRVGSNWKVTSHRLLQIQAEDSDNWEYLGFDLETQSYRFRGPGIDLVEEDWYLRPAEGGTYSQLTRHANWISALSENPELSETLFDPAKVQRSELRSVTVPHASSLDDSKRSALKRILNSRPLSLVQGPPGVGKTTLVNALVNHRFDENPDEKFLVVAHSHETLNHLAEKITKTLVEKGGRLPLLVRAPERETEINAISEVRLYEVSADVADEFERSSLAESLASEYRDVVFSRDTSPELYAPGRSPEQFANDALILRSANVVFATCNSYSIGHLVDTNAQFDWVIVEESAKASGLDLVGALLCAPRLILIGDQEQLPPFDERTWLERLDDPARVGRALEITRYTLPKRLSFSRAQADGDLVRWCLSAKRCFSLFDSLISASSAPTSGLGIVSPLTHQHRMHPAISNLVSSCFYPHLLDADSIENKFQEVAPYEIGSAMVSEKTGVTIVNHTWKQQRRGSRVASDQYVNRDEIDSIESIFKSVRFHEEGRSIAIISPFLKQVEAIKERLEQLPSTDFRGARVDISTVDSFQGKEADVVIVSMVKNNHYTGTNAFGFLVDHRRFNVMLSRAKWKLIVVTSVEFWRAQIEWCESNSVTHIPNFVEWLDRESSQTSCIEIVDRN